MFTVFSISSIVAFSFFSVFSLRVSDYFQLVPGHTDCVVFSKITSLCTKLVSVTCFNFMVMTGDVEQYALTTKDSAVDLYETSYIQFYSSMIETPFLGETYN